LSISIYFDTFTYIYTFTQISPKHGKISFKEKKRRKAEALMSIRASVFCRDQIFILFHSTQLHSVGLWFYLLFGLWFYSLM